MLQPYRGGTWAPSGQTPIQYAWDRRDRLSAMVALSLSPCHRHIGLYHHLQRGNIHGPDAAAFLHTMHHHLQREFILVIDRYSVHRDRRSVCCGKRRRHGWASSGFHRTRRTSTPSKRFGITPSASTWRTSSPMIWKNFTLPSSIPWKNKRQALR